MVGPTRPQFVLFGSSIVQWSFSNEGWGAILAHLYSRKADVILRGYSGWNSTRGLQVIDKIFPKDSPLQPSLVIVYFGGNDSMRAHQSGLGPHVPLPEYIENMKKIAMHLKSLSENTRIIFLSSPPVNEEKIRKTMIEKLGGLGQTLPLFRTNELCKNYSEACLQLCQELNVKFIDIFSAIQKKEDWPTACLCDGIHLSSEGSKIVAKEILKVLKEADWKPSLYRKLMPTEFAEDSPYDPIGPDGKSTLNISEADFTDQWEDY